MISRKIFDYPDRRLQEQFLCRSRAMCDRYQGDPDQKGSTNYGDYKMVNESKLNALVDQDGLSPLACTLPPANTHDSRIYTPTLEAFAIPRMQKQPTIISADAVYDAHEIRRYNRNRRIRINIPVNRRNRKHPKRGRLIKFDPELYKKHNAIERSFGWIEAFRRIVPRYERYERSFLGLIHLACIVGSGEYWDDFHGSISCASLRLSSVRRSLISPDSTPNAVVSICR